MKLGRRVAINVLIWNSATPYRIQHFDMELGSAAPQSTF